MAEARWLDDREQRAWRGFLRCHAQLLRHLGRELQRDTDLTLADYEVLVHLSEAPEGRLRIFELGRALHWEKSRLSHQLTRMERRGLVARADCPTDARGAHVAVTADGRAAIEAAAPRHVAEIRRLFVDALAPHQLVALAEGVEAVLARVDAAEDPPRIGRGAR